jgi:hypothetical protein
MTIPTCPECERLRGERVALRASDMEEAREVKRQRERGDALEAQMARVRAALEGTPANETHLSMQLTSAGLNGDLLITKRNRKRIVWDLLTALRERCLGAAPTGDEGKEGER